MMEITEFFALHTCRIRFTIGASKLYDSLNLHLLKEKEK